MDSRGHCATKAAKSHGDPAVKPVTPCPTAAGLGSKQQSSGASRRDAKFLYSFNTMLISLVIFLCYFCPQLPYSLLLTTRRVSPTPIKGSTTNVARPIHSALRHLPLHCRAGVTLCQLFITPRTRARL